jgi:serine/threonine-protein kinase
VHDVIELVDATYIVMERVDGPELGEYISQQPGGRLPPDRACRIFCHMLSAIEHAHAVGFLHCDIKPANIRLSSAGDLAVLTDWGFSRQLGASPCNASLFGSPAYAAPEQLTGYCPDGISGGQRKLCAAADVWSLGATLHEMLVGCPPFGGESFDALVRNVIKLNYMRSFPDDVPLEAIELVHSMLQVALQSNLHTKLKEWA